MKGRPVTEDDWAAMRAIASAYAAENRGAVPQMAAFSNGAQYDIHKLHVECINACYQLACNLADRSDMSRLERFVYAEMRRVDYRYRLRVAVELLAEEGESLEAVQAMIEPAYQRGARHNRIGRR